MIPTSVDCIILGTGLTNSILSAACSRVGKSVLHVDKNSYYGDEWASFTFQQLIDWIKVNHPRHECLKSIPQELLDKSRQYCIDLCPKLLYSNGPMVDLLVKSNVSRYHEFKNNIRILSMIGNDIHVLPCCRNEVFTSPLIKDLVDKRRLMKFLEMCIKFQPDVDTIETSEIMLNADKPISNFLKERNLNSILQEYIINSIAMVEPSTATIKACNKIRDFMIATERFGRSPFIFPLYGCGEFPQSFCRLSAVFGGVFCLNTQIENVMIGCQDTQQAKASSPAEKFVVQFSNSGHRVKSDMLIMDYNSANELNLADLTEKRDKLSRAILITNKSVVPSDEKHISFLRIPYSQSIPHTVYLLELNSTTTVCPLNMNIVYLWTRSSSRNPEYDLSSTIKRVFGDDMAGTILWEFYYQQLSGPQNGLVVTNEIDGLHITNPPSSGIDYRDSIREAEQIYSTIYPEHEFLPRAPDPDEIVS